MNEWAAKEIVYRSTSELIPYDRNPKIHPDSQIDQLANSIRQWGWTMPILIDEGNQVIAGHGRLYAAQQVGKEEVPCIVAKGWSEEQKKAYVIADNKLAELGSWDNALLYQELKDIGEAKFDLSLTGWSGDFGEVNYNPNLEPSYNFSEITDEVVGRAQDGLHDKIQSLQNDKSNDGIEVMCPHCAETFRFSGG